jgi:hypothetical protein
MLDFLQRAKDIAVPEVPFDPLKLSLQLGQIVVWRSSDQFFELVPLPRDPHRYVEPVQPLLGEKDSGTTEDRARCRRRRRER